MYVWLVTIVFFVTRTLCTVTSEGMLSLASVTTWQQPIIPHGATLPARIPHAYRVHKSTTRLASLRMSSHLGYVIYAQPKPAMWICRAKKKCPSSHEATCLVCVGAFLFVFVFIEKIHTSIQNYNIRTFEHIYINFSTLLHIYINFTALLHIYTSTITNIQYKIHKCTYNKKIIHYMYMNTASTVYP